MNILKEATWDSDFFGYKIASIDNSGRYISRQSLEKALESAQRKKVQCLYLELPYDPLRLPEYSLRKGFILADIRIILAKRLSGQDYPPNRCLTSLKDRRYYSALRQIARELSVYSRFAVDPGFGIMQSRRLYEEWLRKSFYGKFCDDFIIYAGNKKAKGFITIRVKDGVPFIDLLGVKKEARGEGIGSALVEEAQQRLFLKKYRILKVATQARNYSGLGFYLNNGFAVEKISFFYHLWLKKS